MRLLFRTTVVERQLREVQRTSGKSCLMADLDGSGHWGDLNGAAAPSKLLNFDGHPGWSGCCSVSAAFEPLHLAICRPDRVRGALSYAHVTL